MIVQGTVNTAISVTTNLSVTNQQHFRRPAMSLMNQENEEYHTLPVFLTKPIKERVTLLQFARAVVINGIEQVSIIILHDSGSQLAFIRNHRFLRTNKA